jgi:hypothetical protein
MTQGNLSHYTLNNPFFWCHIGSFYKGNDKLHMIMNWNDYGLDGTHSINRKYLLNNSYKRLT